MSDPELPGRQGAAPVVGHGIPGAQTPTPNAVIEGNCGLVLKEFAPNSVDLVATDPPYGISFMGKDWDKAVPSVEIWKECLRVLKPGAFAFVMSLPRLDVLSQMTIRLQNSGFRVDFTPLFWAFASGFPKAMNISKAVMKKYGDPGRKVGTETIDVGIQSGSMHAGRSVDRRQRDIVVPTHPHAVELDGSYAGFQPKPAVEVIIVAMKPLSEETYVEQALENGKGVTWLDSARIPFASNVDAAIAHDNALGPVERIDRNKIHRIYEGGKLSGAFPDTFSEKGRFPANLVVSDDALNDGINHVSGHLDSHTEPPHNQNVYGQHYPREVYNPGDEGSFSRYFSLDEWWDKRVAELPKNVRATFPFLLEPKASKGERNEGLDEFPRKDAFNLGHKENPGRDAPKKSLPRANHHPTVKPLAIMSYLITLGSRRGDLVLDPFAGSGTTVIAAKMLGRAGTGIEVNPEYVNIARARLGAVSTIEEWL